MTSALRFNLRPRRDTDTAFMYSSFLGVMREEPAFRGIGNGRFYAVMTEAFREALDRYETLVAHAESDEDEIAGYFIGRRETGTCVFLYVKHEPWRRCGVARRLLESMFTEAVSKPGAYRLLAMFPTERGLQIAERKGIDVRVMPASCSHIEALALMARAA